MGPPHRRHAAGAQAGVDAVATGEQVSGGWHGRSVRPRLPPGGRAVPDRLRSSGCSRPLPAPTRGRPSFRPARCWRPSWPPRSSRARPDRRRPCPPGANSFGGPRQPPGGPRATHRPRLPRRCPSSWRSKGRSLPPGERPGGRGGRGGAGHARRPARPAEAGCPLVEVHEPAGSLPVDERDGWPSRPPTRSFSTASRTTFTRRSRSPVATAWSSARTASSRRRIEASSSICSTARRAGAWWRWRRRSGGSRRRRRRQRPGGETDLEDIVWAAAYAASTGGRGMERVGIAPSGSLADLPPDRARTVVELLGEAAAVIAGGREAILARLDPRALDARAAALGGDRPRRAHRSGC